MRRMQKRPLACTVIERMRHRNANIHAAVGFERTRWCEAHAIFASARQNRIPLTD